MPPRVVLAGHNLDRALLDELRSFLLALTQADSAAEWDRLRRKAGEILQADNWTPETISAAYARISRDPRAVTELRAIARAEVDRARRSNESIVFGLGHSSVAEHAVFNFDLLGLSRLAVEAVERQRLVSYTEKSQRYILLEEDWVLPEEIRGHSVETAFRELIQRQNRFYQKAYERLLVQVYAAHPDLAGDPGNKRMLEGLAKEDARYVLSLATTVQLGETINARNLERLISSCRAHSLREVRDLAGALDSAVGGLAPSLIKYTEPTSYQRSARPALSVLVQGLSPNVPGEDWGAGDPYESPIESGDPVQLVSTTPDPDGTLVAALLYAGGYGAMSLCRERAQRLDLQKRRDLIWSHLEKLGPHDPVLREYEHVDLVYDLIVSASCFAQLKRHRMATQTPLEYNPALGITVPPSYEPAGLLVEFREIAAASERCARAIAEVAREAQGYALTNAHRRRVLLKLNARELIHLSRLREDAHAQWDIRQVASRMVENARKVMPLTLLLAGGKDRFEERKRELGPT